MTTSGRPANPPPLRSQLSSRAQDSPRQLGLRLSRRAMLHAAGLALVAYPAHALARASALEDLLGRRRMIRSFKPAPVDEAVVRRLIRTATRAPSAGNTQPWAFIVVRDPSTRKKLAHAALGQMFVAEAPLVIVACADSSRSTPRYGTRGEQYAVIDTAFASLLLLLKVVEEGLGATFVGAFHDDRVRALLALPSHVLPLAVIPIGVPAEPPRDVPVRPARAVTHHERW